MPRIDLPVFPPYAAGTRVVPLDAADPRERWAAILNPQDLAALRELAEAGVEVLHGFAPGLAPLRHPFYRLVYRPFGALMDESDLLARELGSPRVDPAMMALLQRLYSWSTFPVGCTSAAYRDGDAMYHVRCLDWEEPGREIARATRIYDFRRAGRTWFRAVGVLGMVGLLSGVRPGAFSVSINWAPSRSLPWFLRDPTIRLREVLDDPAVRTYEQAVQALAASSLAGPVFFTVVGAAPGEAVVVECAKPRPWRVRSHLRRMDPRGGVLVQTNHYDPGGANREVNRQRQLRDLDEPDAGYSVPLRRSSRQRREAMERRLAGLRGQALADPVADLRACLDTVPVRNHATRQQMVLVPASGEIHLWCQP